MECNGDYPTNGYCSLSHYTSDEDVAVLKSSGYVAFQTFDRDGKYLKTYEEWSADPSTYQMYFMSLTNPVKRIFRFDFASERDLRMVKELLESQSIVKVTRKVAFASLLLHRQHQIELCSVIDLTATNYLVNQVGINSGNLVNPCIVEDVGDTVQINMLRLAKVWFRLYGHLYCNLITLTQQNLDLFRSFQLD